MKKEKIHVCHLVYGFNVGGLERIIVNCINSLDPDKFQHTIISLTTVGDFIHEIVHPVEHYALDKKSGNDISVYFTLYRLFRKIKPDVLHTYNLATIEYHWLALAAGIPRRIHAEHGRDSYDPNGSVKKYQILRKVCSVAIHQIIAVSDDLKNWLTLEVKIPAKKVKLIINGVDTAYFDRDACSTEDNQLFKSEDKFVFGHIARLHQIKNQQLILEAFLQAGQRCPQFLDNCTLMIIGDGPDRESLESFVAEHKRLKTSVFFVGAKTNVREYYQKFDVFLMSSIAEGIPMTLLESMSMSIPHLVTNVGGIKEVIQEGRTGLSVESNNLDSYVESMLALYQNPALVPSMSVGARTRIVSKFSQDLMMEQYRLSYRGEAISD